MQCTVPVSQEIWTLGNLDAASIFPRKFDRLNFLKRQFFLRIYGRLRKFCRLNVFKTQNVYSRLCPSLIYVTINILEYSCIRQTEQEFLHTFNSFKVAVDICDVNGFIVVCIIKCYFWLVP